MKDHLLKEFKRAEAQDLVGLQLAHYSIREYGCIACSVSAFLKSLSQNRLETLLQEGFGEKIDVQVQE